MPQGGVSQRVVGRLLFFLTITLVGVLWELLLFSTALAEEAASTQAPPIDLMGEAVQVAGYLLILIILAALVVHLGRCFRPGLGGHGPIHVVDGRNLAPGVGVRLIRIGSQGWLVGVTKDRVSLLSEVAMEDLTETLPPSARPEENKRTEPMGWTAEVGDEPKV